ncbi:TetR/AcrR family transcriptional regulator [Microbacterium sp. P01]|uniref:TetR/AcrR family transcriptional regulator n=1 Tax=Microbacterium sp. P01 TaxID=3366261 RepID=UPI00366C3426
MSDTMSTPAGTSTGAAVDEVADTAALADIPPTPANEAVPASARRERTRQRLLDAAAQVFAEVGLDAASVEAICERAGFTRGAFYSNFVSKDELFLELAGRVSDEKLSAVTERVRELESASELSGSPGELVGRLLDVENDSRSGVLLLSEIRNRALRDATLAASYTRWEDAMTSRVADLIRDIVRASGLPLKLPPEDLAQMFLTTWETAALRAAMDGLDDAELCLAINARMRILAEVIAG